MKYYRIEVHEGSVYLYTYDNKEELEKSLNQGDAYHDAVRHLTESPEFLNALKHSGKLEENMNIIIRGDIVVPEPVVRVEEYEIPE